MSCTLSKYETYDVANVKHDVSGGQYVLRLSRPPETCKEGLFVSKNPEVRVNKNTGSPTLTYNAVSRKPVIVVNSMDRIESINVPGSSFLSITLWLGVLCLVCYGIYRLLKKVNEPALAYSTSGRYEDAIASRERLTWSGGQRVPVTTTPVQNQGGGTTVVNNSNDGLLTGVLLGSMMNNNSSHHDHYVTREVHHDHYIDQSDDNDRSSSYSDDSSSSSSYSSDDRGTSSYSSSGSDSYSSYDSGSSYSDSGGGSFSSD